MNEILEARERIRPYVRLTAAAGHRSGRSAPPQSRVLPAHGQLQGAGGVQRGSCQARGRSVDEGRDCRELRKPRSRHWRWRRARRGLKAVIIIPAGCESRRRCNTRATYGAPQVIQDGVTFANREQRLRDEMEVGARADPPVQTTWDVIHGQGTVAMEMLERTRQSR